MALIIGQSGCVRNEACTFEFKQAVFKKTEKAVVDNDDSEDGDDQALFQLSLESLKTVVAVFMRYETT